MSLCQDHNIFKLKDSFTLLLLTRLEKEAPTCSKAKLKEEIDHLKRVLLKHNCPVVFCHNDLLCKNIVYNKTKGRSYNFMMQGLHVHYLLMLT